MAKTKNGKLAIEALKHAGIEVVEDLSDEETEYGTTQFAIADKSYNGWHKYFDMSGQWIRESVVNGEIINRSGIRHSIVEILDQFCLEFDFYDGGTLEVYDIKEEHRTPPWTVEPRPDDRPMSKNAFTAFKKLARMGAPVWDFDSYSRTYNPTSLPPGTQFVMTCEPNLDRIFAEHDGNWNTKFPETDGLRSDVHEIIVEFGLGHRPHMHVFEDTKFRPINLVAFFDPIATTQERGVVPIELKSLVE